MNLTFRYCWHRGWVWNTHYSMGRLFLVCGKKFTSWPCTSGHPEIFPNFCQLFHCEIIPLSHSTLLLALHWNIHCLTQHSFLDCFYHQLVTEERQKKGLIHLVDRGKTKSTFPHQSHWPEKFCITRSCFLSNI